MEQVVKCKNCGLYYGLSDQQNKCPFPDCDTPYKTDDKKTKEDKGVPVRLTVIKKEKKFVKMSV
jgi:hypothetical protein